MLLLRLMDMDDGADEGARGARGPRGLLDFEWFDRYARGGLPPAQGGVMGNLVAVPKDPNDPVWSILHQGLPWPMRRHPYPAARWPLQPLPMPFPGHPPLWPANAPPWADGDDWHGAARRQIPFWPAMPLDVAAMPLAHASGENPPAPRMAVDSATDDAPRTMGPAPLSESTRVAQAGPVQDWQMPITPGQDTIVDDIEREFRGLAKLGRSLGLKEAPTDLEHFLGGSGEPRIIHRDRARQFGPIKEGESVNESRQEKAFIDPEKHGRALIHLKDGQTIYFSDNFDRDYNDWDFAKQLLDPETRDFAIAFGNTKLATKGKFAATRVGDEIRIEGNVGHYWDDDYDFHPERYLGLGGFKARDAAILEQHGRAKSFARKSSWPRRLKGKVRIENGVLKDPVFTWEDIDQ